MDPQLLNSFFSLSVSIPLRQFFKRLLPLLIGAGMVGCSTIPETGRKQFLLTSSTMEVQQGEAAFAQIKRQKQAEPAAKDQLERVGRRIAAVAPVPNAQWEFVVFKDSTPNAFALPGGKVGVNSGILPITRNDAGLAAVVGHEVAHVVARHGGERMSQGLASSIGAAVLDAGLAIGTGASAGTRGAILQAYGIGANLGVLLPFSRRQEHEADRLGLLYMARAGYDPREAILFWERFSDYQRQQGGGKMPEFLSTHPLDEHRIEQLKAHLPEALAEYEKAKKAR